MGTKRGRNACGHGAIGKLRCTSVRASFLRIGHTGHLLLTETLHLLADWNNESVRIAKFVNIKNTSRWNGIGHNFVRTPECTFLCLACMKHPGAKASVWTKGGNKVSVLATM